MKGHGDAEFAVVHRADIRPDGVVLVCSDQTLSIAAFLSPILRPVQSSSPTLFAQSSSCSSPHAAQSFASSSSSIGSGGLRGGTGADRCPPFSAMGWGERGWKDKGGGGDLLERLGCGDMLSRLVEGLRDEMVEILEPTKLGG